MRSWRYLFAPQFGQLGMTSAYVMSFEFGIRAVPIDFYSRWCLLYSQVCYGVSGRQSWKMTGSVRSMPTLCYWRWDVMVPNKQRWALRNSFICAHTFAFADEMRWNVFAHRHYWDYWGSTVPVLFGVCSMWATHIQRQCWSDHLLEGWVGFNQHCSYLKMPEVQSGEGVLLVESSERMTF